MTFSDFLNISFRRKAPHVPQKVEQAQVIGGLPIVGGQSSVPDDTSLFSGINGKTKIQPPLPKEYILALEHLSMYHPDISHAVANVVELGASEHKITFPDTVPESVAKKAMLHLKARDKQLYGNNEGSKSLIIDLMRQAVIAGCVSAEIVPRLDLRCVDAVVLVKPHQIEFLRDKETRKYKPYQRPKSALDASTESAAFGLVELNPETYKIFVLQRLNDNPYPIPPFVAGIENTNIGKNLLSALKYVAANLGVLGVTTVTSKPPLKLQNESEAAYLLRCKSQINDMREEAQKGLKNALFLGFKDSLEVNVSPTHANARDAKQLFDINDQQLMSGLKQEPSLLGRDMKTSEAFAKIAYKILARRIEAYQDLVAAFLSELYRIELQLSGFKIETVIVEFDRVDMTDQLMEAQAEAVRIANVIAKYEAGIISMQQMAEELGYEKPDQDKPRTTQNTEGGKNDLPPIPPKNTQKNARFDYESEERANVSRETPLTQLDYTDADNGFEDAEMQRLYENYTRKVKGAYKEAITEGGKALEASLIELGVTLTEAEILAKVIYHLAANVEIHYTPAVEAIADKYITDGYTKFRKDANLFNGKAVGEAVLDLPDYRAMTYFKRSDKLYLGKFITDDDTMKRLTQFIKDTYLRDGEAISNNPTAIARFRRSLVNHLSAEDWKINRVIATTVSKMRNYAAVNYMLQADVKEYEIRGVNDRKQCAYCKELQGRRFSVQDVAARLDHITAREPEFVKTDAPFLTSIFKSADDMKGLTDAELFHKGFFIVPAHCHCRDVVVPIL